MMMTMMNPIYRVSQRKDEKRTKQASRESNMGELGDKSVASKLSTAVVRKSKRERDR